MTSLNISLPILCVTPTDAAYNRTQHLDERRRMMTRWANYLDSLKAAAAGQQTERNKADPFSDGMNVNIAVGNSGFPFGDGLARYPRKLCQIFLREAHCLAACLYFSADIEMLSRHRASIPLPADKFKPMRGRGAAGISRLVADSHNQTLLH